MLTVSQLSYRFGARRVLDRITFSADSGNFIGIVGPNGSGKTTLLRLLQRTYKPESGTILFKGKHLHSYSSRGLAQQIASVSQLPFFAFPFLAEQLVLLGRTPYLNFFKRETDTDRKFVEDAMRQTDCLEFTGKPISELSAGELQRVCIAAALAQRPEILLLDEPSSFLDLRQAARLSRLLVQLQNQGLTIVCASHDLQFLKKQNPKILLLNEGTQVGFGNHDEILTQETLRALFDLTVEIHAC